MTTDTVPDSARRPAAPTPPTAVSRPIARRTWERAGLATLLLSTALLYLWGLSASGWANSFYSAAAQAGSESWQAFFFGSSDAANSITVDKTPLALWPMALSVRIFGLSSWSLLVPQALAGVGAVALLYATVRRVTGSFGAALLAGSVLALTPVAVLMFRFNNPDALLVLLLIGSAYATLRAVESTTVPTGHPVRWLALGGALVGLGFLTKMLQAFLVLPALALVYALFAAVPLWRRLGHLAVAFGSMVLAGGWYLVIVELWPASARPWIGGSQENSILELTLGYNGLGRLNGEETGSVGGGNGWGETGLLRMFSSDVGGQIAWLIPAAVILGCGALWFSSRLQGRTRVAVRAALTLWLGWLLVTLLTFSFMAGIFHSYYTVALAPAIAALVGIGAFTLWRTRAELPAAMVLAFAMAFTTGLSFMLLDRTDWHPWLKYAVATLGFASALMIAGVRYLPRRVVQAVAATALVAGLLGPTAYSLSTAATAHTGSLPTAGPTTGTASARGGGGGGGGAPGGAPGQAIGGATGGGLLSGSEPTAAITELLAADAESYTWVAAAVGSNSASGYQLATEEPVMPIGGFNGSDPSPTLEEFQQYVADGEIHYFIASDDGGGAGGGRGPQTSGSTSGIATWVAENFASVTVDGITFYDLSDGAR